MKKQNLLKSKDVSKTHIINTKAILNNNYYSPEFDERMPNFDILVRNEIDEDMEISIEESYFEIVSQIANEDPKLKNLGHPDFPNPKLDKNLANYVYVSVSRHPLFKKSIINRPVLFSVITEYFNFDYCKFYDLLSNLYKEELQDSIQNLSKILEIKKINKLF
jgi:hypothetical protein